MKLFFNINIVRLIRKFAPISMLTVSGLTGVVYAGEFNSPWRDKSRGLIIDAYDKNDIDWQRLVKDRRIVGFIGKASDGLPTPWGCKSAGNKTEKTLCQKAWDNYALRKKLYHSRRLIAKTLGLKWGAYHVGRGGDPIGQAYHFLKYADPQEDELIALDIEHGGDNEWISLADAEIFVKYIKTRLDRYPLLYTNHATAKMIANDRHKYPLLSRLKLWYPRYRSNIRGVFPLGNWGNYQIWQFSSHVNCSKKRCLYRPPGTPRDIDVNVTRLSVSQLRKAWPFKGIWPESIPIPQLAKNKDERTISTISEINQTMTQPEDDLIICSTGSTGELECETN